MDFDGQRGSLMQFDRQGRYCYSMPGAAATLTTSYRTAETPNVFAGRPCRGWA
jgi:hypothetical protein